MTNRLSKWSRHSSRLVCLLAACGLMYACKDEFVLDDEKPSWLNSSIYESLEQKGNFRTYLKLLADKDVNPEGVRSLTDVLNRTGSKTVFVANDSAWDAFFAANAKLPEANPWHYATSYENLSQAQKKLLIHTSMLNNAIVMENLASSQSSGTSSPTRGEYMRRYTDVEATDSITFLPSVSEDPAGDNLPYSYSVTEKDYWARFRASNGGHGIYLAIDSTLPMMLHFTSEHMSRNTVKDEDFALFMGRERNTSDVHIYDALLKEKDGVCENGYVNVTEKPLCPLTNMAEVIRTNGKTNIFSHILDRFSAPFYCARITEAYRVLHPDFPAEDSIFTKRYFSNNNFSVKAGYVRPNADNEIPKFEPGPKGTYQKYDPYLVAVKQDDIDKDLKDRIPALKFDPGWNGYYDEVDVRKDMAAIFVPSDEELWHYFTKGSGQRLLKVYYAKEGDPDAIEWVPPTEGDYEGLYRQIDCIPLGTIDKLVYNLQQRTFVGSVPSKWSKLTDDAMEPLFENVEDAINQLDTALICSNGVVYVMGCTPVPADYRSVTAPAFISRSNKIMKSAIYDDYMNLNYYAYLKAMQSRFTFLLPSDNALAYYYDPASMKSRTPRAVKFSFVGGSFPVKLQFYNYYCPYNKDKGTIGTISTQPIPGTSLYTNDEVKNRLKDILESHTIVHDGTNPMSHTGNGNTSLPSQEYYGIPTSDPLPEYYLSKNGNAIKVVRDEEDNVIALKGGFQLENERQGIESETPGVLSCHVVEPNETDNGYTFVLDAPLVPTYRSVYSHFTNDEDRAGKVDGVGGETPYSNFYDLCTADGYETEIIGCGLVDANLTKTQREAGLKKFKIFIDDKGLDYNVQFFNNYRYTIFVPTNDAVMTAIEDGLPTWEDIREDFRTHCKPVMVENEDGTEWVVKYDADGEIEYTDSLQTYEDSVRIAAKITYLTNFVRYHFADNSVFADRTVLAPNEMVTSSYDKELELFCKLHVDRVPNGDGTDLRVCDDVTWKKNGNSMGATPFVTVGEKNVLARDISCSSTPVDVAMKGITINSSSAAVIHSIDGYLNHTEVIDGRHDKTWESTIRAKRYLQRYAIR
ncbi:MAG: hypothetical protein J6W03_10580 [Bacteroidaceae bacterium]|nr:hypothetical protein [Bacteroidaceae bacterium]